MKHDNVLHSLTSVAAYCLAPKGDRTFVASVDAVLVTSDISICNPRRVKIISTAVNEI